MTFSRFANTPPPNEWQKDEHRDGGCRNKGEAFVFTSSRIQK
jgi:hypothetical protein